jgi:hypothetical protein
MRNIFLSPFAYRWKGRLFKFPVVSRRKGRGALTSRWPMLPNSVHKFLITFMLLAAASSYAGDERQLDLQFLTRVWGNSSGVIAEFGHSVLFYGRSLRELYPLDIHSARYQRKIRGRPTLAGYFRNSRMVAKFIDGRFPQREGDIAIRSDVLVLGEAGKRLIFYPKAKPFVVGIRAFFNRGTFVQRKKPNYLVRTHSYLIPHLETSITIWEKNGQPTPKQKCGCQKTGKF